MGYEPTLISPLSLLSESSRTLKALLALGQVQVTAGKLGLAGAIIMNINGDIQ